MITGLETPTSGNIQVLGFNYPEQWHDIQKVIGFCPQYSILYPDMTVREHLDFYGKLKGLEDEIERIQAIDMSEQITKNEKGLFLTNHFFFLLPFRLIDSMAMEQVQDRQVKNLSEGMQRRVCVSLAFIGGSKVIVLDEPTAGVDPIAR